MINIFGVEIIVAIVSGQYFRNNNVTNLSFEEFFHKVGYKAYWGR